jgi:predicted Rossmann fold flavoprotein
VIQRFDAVVLGAGAAGLMCAIEAGKRGRRIAVLDHAPRIGKKILISGGGRCNFTNLHCRPEYFISANPHFAKSALARYTPADFIALVEKHRIPYHEKKLGQLFCDGSSSDLLAMLERECAAAGVAIFPATRVQEVSRPDEFVLRADNAEFRAPALVVATGGLSIPKMGASGFGYEVARQFGVKVRECRPALVPLTFAPEDCRNYGGFSGISVEVVASVESRDSGQVKAGARFREKMLITHRGVSGPAILQISSYWKPGAMVVIDLAPERDLTAPLRASPNGRDASAARALFRAALPARFADRWLELHQPTSWTNHTIDELERQVHRWQIAPGGTEGYEKAEVTVGGVDTDELSAKTMESRSVPGLHFIGEVVDVTGHLGGFNFQWAWASGYSAGQAI